MKESQKLTICQWAKEDRPREKMMVKGADALSDAELLAILIGSGNTEESAVELMRRILVSCHNDLNELARWEVRDYSRFKGFGPAKSITVMAALELGKRRRLQEIKERAVIRCSKDIYEVFHPLMCDLALEEFWVLLINQGNKVISSVRISTGGIAGTFVDVRSILREALLQRATQIAVVHNHPSGNIHPSQEDQVLTQRIFNAAKSIDIKLIDHVIVCDGKYYSFADEGLIQKVTEIYGMDRFLFYISRYSKVDLKKLKVCSFAKTYFSKYINALNFVCLLSTANENFIFK